MKIIIFTFIIIVFAITSCSTVEPLEEYSSDQIYPLAVGNEWEYKYEVFQNDSLILSGISKIEVVEKTKIQSDQVDIVVYKVKETKDAYWTNALLVSYYLYNYEDSMLFRFGFAMTNDTDYFYRKDPYLKYPLIEGDQWYEDHGDYRNVFVCMSVNDSVFINNKKYSCIRIRTGGGGWYRDKYYAQGYGLIQEIAEVKTDNKRYEKTTLLKMKIYKPT